MKRRKKFLVPTAKFSIIIENYNEIFSAKGTTKSLRAKYLRNVYFSNKQSKIKEPYGIGPNGSPFKIYASDLANLFLILQLAVNNALSSKSSV